MNHAYMWIKIYSWVDKSSIRVRWFDESRILVNRIYRWTNKIFPWIKHTDESNMRIGGRGNESNKHAQFNFFWINQARELHPSSWDLLGSPGSPGISWDLLGSTASRLVRDQSVLDQSKKEHALIPRTRAEKIIIAQFNTAQNKSKHESNSGAL